MRIEAAGMAMAAVRAAENLQGKEDRENNALPEKSAKPRGRDIYLPYEEESAGIYEVGFEDGRRVIGIDPFNGENSPAMPRTPKSDEENSPENDGERASEAEEENPPEAPGDRSPKADSGKRPPKSEKEKSGGNASCTGNTDKVDREIKALKEKIKKIKQQAERAEGKERERLSNQLSALESELAQKDCDSYRRQHSEFR